jgi:Sensors of blue-light using FAD
MPLIRIVYYSERNPAVGLDMRRLLDCCERNNPRDNIGGFLHYNGTYFLQVLEGDRDFVRALYRRIEIDRAHMNLVLIGAETVTERKFEHWTMGLNAGVANPTRETFMANFAASSVDPALLAG